MLGAQALRTKQKVDQKEREKRHKERQRNLEIQRERIQRAANEDAQAAMMEYAAAAAAEAASTSADEEGAPTPAELAQRFHQLAMGGVQPTVGGFPSGRGGPVNRKIHQRYSLNAASFHQIPSSARDSFSYERPQVPQRSPSTDCGSGSGLARSSRSGSGGVTSGSGSGSTNRFLRWLGIGNSPSIGHMPYGGGGAKSHGSKSHHNGGAATARRDSRPTSAEKRRMSTY